MVGRRNRAMRQGQVKQGLGRSLQRFLTGFLLGVILVLTVGGFTPLLAQSHDWTAQNIITQIFSDPLPEEPPLA